MAASVRPAPRRRLPAAERRAQILRIARAHFLEHGLEKASLRAIARDAGVSATAIYEHFRDKDDLKIAIADAFFEILLDTKMRATAGIEDPLLRFRAMGRAYIETGLAHPEEYRLVFMTPIAGIVRRRPGAMRLRRPPEELAASGAGTKGSQSFAMLEGAVRDLMAAGMFRKAPVEPTAEAVWAAMHGLVALRITHGEFDFSSLDAQVEAVTAMVVNGLRAR